MINPTSWVESSRSALRFSSSWPILGGAASVVASALVALVASNDGGSIAARTLEGWRESEQ